MKEPRKSPPRKSHAKAEEKLDEELEESFPASDPPVQYDADLRGGPGPREASRARQVAATPLTGVRVGRALRRWPNDERTPVVAMHFVLFGDAQAVDHS